MKTHMQRNIFIVGAAALALGASVVAFPSVADAKGAVIYPHGHGSPRGSVGGNFRGRGSPGYYGGNRYYGGNGYYGGYYPGFCGPIQLTLGLCGPWGY